MPLTKILSKVIPAEPAAGEAVDVELKMKLENVRPENIKAAELE